MMASVAVWTMIRPEKNAVQALNEKYGIRICDLSHEYSGYKDLNEYLCGKNNRLHNNRGIEKTI